MNTTYVCYTLKISVFTSVLDCGLLWHNTADWGAYIIEINFITVLEAWSPRSRCWQGWFLVRALFLACGWLPSHCIFIWSFLCRFTEGERESFLATLPLLLSTPILLGLTPYSYDLSSVGPQLHGLQHARPLYPSPTLRVGDRQGGLACCSPLGCKESDTTEPLNWTDSKWTLNKIVVV